MDANSLGAKPENEKFATYPMKKNATMPGLLPTPWGIRKTMSSP